MREPRWRTSAGRKVRALTGRSPAETAGPIASTQTRPTEGAAMTPLLLEIDGRALRATDPERLTAALETLLDEAGLKPEARYVVFHCFDALSQSEDGVRYYESIGLMSAPVRSDNGYRSYTEGALRELRFVKRARETGFNLEECQELLALYRNEHRTSAQVKKLAQEKIVDLRSRIAGLQAMLTSLEGLVCCCHGDENPECPILDELERG